MPATATALVSPVAAELTPTSSEVSTTLPVSAGVAYEVFADAIETPRWLPILQSARVVARGPNGRPTRVNFGRRLDRGSINYTLDYRYDADTHTVAWATADSSVVLMTGEARFLPLSARACLMVYRLTMDLSLAVQWSEAGSDGHPASSVVADFREHLKRLS